MRVNPYITSNIYNPAVAIGAIVPPLPKRILVPGVSNNIPE